jgi:histidine phosphotransferase ChpT
MLEETQVAPLDLVARVAARICHDFAGLLGTLDGLTALAGEDAEAAALAHETARRLSARVRLLRCAWAGVDEVVDAAAVAALAFGLHGGERLLVDTAALKGALDGRAARLCVCLLIVAAGALPRGGKIVLGGNQDGFWVSIEGRNAAWPDALAKPPPAAPCGPREMPVFLCNALAREAGWRIHLHNARATAQPQ